MSIVLLTALLLAGPGSPFVDLDYEQALQQATARDRLLVVDVTAEWCAPCQHMEQTVWHEPRVVAWVAEHAVAIQVDADARPDLLRRWWVVAAPVTIIVRGDTVLARTAGEHAADELLSWLEAALAGRPFALPWPSTGERMPPVAILPDLERLDSAELLTRFEELTSRIQQGASRSWTWFPWLRLADRLDRAPRVVDQLEALRLTCNDPAFVPWQARGLVSRFLMRHGRFDTAAQVGIDPQAAARRCLADLGPAAWPGLVLLDPPTEALEPLSGDALVEHLVDLATLAAYEGDADAAQAIGDLVLQLRDDPAVRLDLVQQALDHAEPLPIHARWAAEALATADAAERSRAEVVATRVQERWRRRTDAEGGTLED